jgi:NADPH-dependent ferric siderophore reductase
VTAVDPELIPTHVTAVVRTERITSTFVRVTFGGGLERFEPAGPDQFVYVLLPPPGRFALTIGTDFTWSQHAAMPAPERPVGAYYSVRHVRPAAGELDCDVFLHEPAGPVSSWAMVAGEGAPAALWGPRTAWSPPPGTRRWLLVADETGWPATQAVLEALPGDAEVTVLVEVSDADALGPLASAVRLLPRGTAPAGTTDLLVDAVRSLDLDAANLYAWGGAESRSRRDVRRHLRDQVGLGRDQVSMTPYWRHPQNAEDSESSK